MLSHYYRRSYCILGRYTNLHNVVLKLGYVYARGRYTQKLLYTVSQNVKCSLHFIAYQFKCAFLLST